MAKTPVIRTNQGVMPNPNHRVVLDDNGWGLCVLISIAERLESAGIKCPTTMMRAMVEWHQSMMGKEYLFNGRLRGRDIAELVLLGPNDPLELVARAPGTEARPWLTQAEKQAEEDRYGNPLAVSFAITSQEACGLLVVLQQSLLDSPGRAV